MGSSHKSQPRFSLTGEELQHLVAAAVSLHTEADRCAEAGCWRAALILIGSAVEAAITATAVALEPELRERGLWPSGRCDDPTRWTLGIAIGVAIRAGWLPAPEPDQQADVSDTLGGSLGDATRFVNSLRNMATHPGANLREPVRPDFADVENARMSCRVFQEIAGEVFAQLAGAVNHELGRARPAES